MPFEGLIFVFILAVLGLAAAALFLPILWIVEAVLIVALVVYLWGRRGRSKLSEGPGSHSERPPTPPGAGP